MKDNTLLLAFLLFIGIPLLAQGDNVIIHGSAPDYIGSISFPAIPSGVSKSINNTARVDVVFNNAKTDDINIKIVKFNRHYEDFFRENISLLAAIARPYASSSPDGQKTSKKSAIQRYTEKLNQFSAKMDSLYPENKKGFFYQYRRSIEADMYQNAYTTPKFIYDNYMPVNLHNIDHPEQMILLANFYDKYLHQFREKFDSQSLDEALVSDNPLQSTLTVLGKDDFLENPALKKIILLFGLHDAWYDNSINRESILGMLVKLTQDNTDGQIKRLAENILNKLTRTAVGVDAYNFDLLDANQQVHRLADYKGKYVVLEFWATWCQSCLKEMKLSSGLQEKYKDRFEFISISVDEHDEDVWQFDESNRALNQTLLHQGKDKLILDNYDIRSLPAYILLDKEGKIIDPNAPFPSLVLESLLYKLNVEEEKLKKDNFDIINRD